VERSEHLKYCTTCTKREFNKTKGVVCSLTNEWADFNSICKDYKFDVYLEQFEKRREAEKSIRYAEDNLFGLAKFGLTKTILSGVVITIAGLIWLTAGLKVGLIFYYPVALIISGLVILIKGFFTELRKPKRKKTNDNIIDNES